jgi:hypothetical protein
MRVHGNGDGIVKNTLAAPIAPDHHQLISQIERSNMNVKRIQRLLQGLVS